MKKNMAIIAVFSDMTRPQAKNLSGAIVQVHQSLYRRGARADLRNPQSRLSSRPGFDRAPG